MRGGFVSLCVECPRAPWLTLLAGVNPKVASERLGHASVVITLDAYSHVLPTMQEAAADRLDLKLYSC